MESRADGYSCQSNKTLHPWWPAWFPLDLDSFLIKTNLRHLLFYWLEKDGNLLIILSEPIRNLDEA